MAVAWDSQPSRTPDVGVRMDWAPAAQKSQRSLPMAEPAFHHTEEKNEGLGGWGAREDLVGVPSKEGSHHLRDFI